MQYLSLGPPMAYWAPPALGLSVCRVYTDEIGKVARDHPDGSSASPPPLQYPGRAVAELDRAVDLGFRGVGVGSNVHDRSTSRYATQIQMLDLPLFIHPINPLGQPHIHDYRLDYRRLPEGPHRRT